MDALGKPNRLLFRRNYVSDTGQHDVNDDDDNDNTNRTNGVVRTNGGWNDNATQIVQMVEIRKVEMTVRSFHWDAGRTR